MSDNPSVLFVCVHNAGRSQIAAALLRHHAMGRVEVRSAGSAPGQQVNPAARTVLEEWGINVTDAQPSKLDPSEVEQSDVVVTMGCGDACPIFPGVSYEDWELEDPAGQPGTVRAISKIPLMGVKPWKKFDSTLLKALTLSW